MRLSCNREARAVILVIDRLGAAWLGPYGNTWLDTPNFNRLAVGSLQIETAMSDSPEHEVYCRSLWTGRHAMQSVEAGPTLATLVREAGGRSQLITDDPQVHGHVLANGFVERRLLEAARVMEPVQQADASGLFRFFAAARTAVEDFCGPGLLCLFSRGMAAPWDAPLELRYQFADELDPDPPSLVEPPNRMLEAKHDPDELLGLVQAYAGQVALADMCLGPFLDAFEAHPLAGETLLVVTSPRGYPLGEHRRVGPCDDALYGELLHVPLWIRVPGLEGGRQQSIVQPHQVHSHIAQYYGWSGSRAEPALPSVAYSMDQRERAIRTPAWFLREQQSESGPVYELFVKPDDRFEANEVSSRCGDVVELLAAELARFAESAAAGQPAEAGPLPEVLCDIWR
jgi:hypothetical protein